MVRERRRTQPGLGEYRVMGVPLRRQDDASEWPPPRVDRAPRVEQEPPQAPQRGHDWKAIGAGVAIVVAAIGGAGGASQLRPGVTHEQLTEALKPIAAAQKARMEYDRRAWDARQVELAILLDWMCAQNHGRPPARGITCSPSALVCEALPHDSPDAGACTVRRYEWPSGPGRP